MFKRFSLVCLMFLVLFSPGAFAWYNDVGNDSCLVISADRARYGISKFNSEIEALLLFENNCGARIEDADLGLFIPTGAVSAVKFKSIHLFVPNKIVEVERSYTCEHDFDYTLNPNYATCFEETVDANGSESTVVFWQGPFETGNLAEKTVYWTEATEVKDHWRDVTSIVNRAIDARNIPIGLHGFDLKYGWKDVSIPKGETKFKVLFDVPFYYDGRKEFVVAARSRGNHLVVSVLDPDWWNEDWSYKMKVTLKTSDMNLSGNITSDHAVLVDLNDSHSDFWTHVDSDGADVRFVDVAETAEYDFYFQDFNYANQTMLAWVKVTDTFPSASNVDFYVYYGNAGAANAEDAASTLSDFNAVYHFDEFDGEPVPDATGDFDANTSELAWDNTTKLRGQGSLYCDGIYNATQGTLLDTVLGGTAMSWWFRPDVTITPDANPENRLISKYNESGQELWIFYFYGSAPNKGKIRSYWIVGGDTSEVFTETDTWNADTWYFIVASWDTVNGMYVRVNDTAEIIAPSLTAIMGAGTDYDFQIGANYNGANVFDGRMDELRVWEGGLTVDEMELVYQMEIGNLQEYGAEETGRVVGDVNFWRVEGYDPNVEEFPAFYYSVDGNLTIDFNVSNIDNNRMTVDINYSATSAQGNGTVIAEDLNLTSGVCPSQDWDANASSCSWDWNISAVPDGNYYVLIRVDSNKEAFPGMSVFVNSFKTLAVARPTFTPVFLDENSFDPLQGLTVDVDGTEYETDSEGKISIDMATFPTDTYTISAWQDSNYPVRYFEMDLNAFDDVNVNFYMLRDTNGQGIDFKFYDTDETTVLGNAEVIVLYDENVCSIRATDADGETSFFLAPDRNYVFQILTSGGVAKRYYPVGVTIQIPRDEGNTNPITPYDLTVGGLGSENWLAQEGTITYYILSNTVSYYHFDVNAGLTYYSRTYYLNLQGNPTTYSLQPYLVKVAGGISSIFTVRKNYNSAGLPGIRIVSKKNIAGEGLVVVEEVETDSAGEAALSFIENDTYFIEAYEGDILRFSGELRPTATTYQIYLDLGELVVEEPIITGFDIDFRPEYGIAWVYADDNFIDLNQTITVTEASIASATVVVTNAGATLYDETTVGGVGTTTMFFSQAIDSATVDSMATISVTVTVVTTAGQTHVAAKRYYIQSTHSTAASKLLPMLFGFADENLGGSQAATSVIAIIITLMVVGAAAVKVTTDTSGLMFIALAVLGLFTFLGWVPLGPFVLACLAGFALFVVLRRFT